jgi:ATP-dependent DNA helicase RecG
MSENQKVEYKEVWRDEFLKHLCAFANTKGGTLFVGIKDDGLPVGISNSKKLLEDIPNKVIQYLGIAVDVDLQFVENKEIVRIDVVPSSVPISFHGKYFVRSGSTVQELKDSKLREFILKKDNVSWDEILIKTARLDDIDYSLVSKFVRKAVNVNRLPEESSEENVEMILHKLDLINSDNELTRACILLFGKRPSKYIRTANIKIGKFGETDADLISHDVIDGNILEMPDKVMEILKTKYLHSIISYEGIERVEKLEYPEKAIREALLNAIVHRNYGDNTDVTISVYDNKIIFWNSGELIEPLNVSMLKEKHPSKRRNVLVANVFFAIGYIEAWGRGTLLMNNEARKFDMPEPLIEESAGGIKVTFIKKPEITTKTFRNEGLNEGLDEGLNEGLNSLLQTILKYPGLQNKELSERLNNRPIKTIERQISELVKLKIVERRGSKKNGGYIKKSEITPKTFRNEGLNKGLNEGLSEELSEGLNSLLQTILKYPGLQNKELSERLNNRPIKTIERQISELVKLKIVERRGSKKTGGYYVVSE